jgi:hypothetical protein
MEYLGRLAVYEGNPQLWLISAENLASIPDQLTHSSPFFALFTAMDLSLSEIQASEPSAVLLVNAGLAYFCAFGKNCEALHDRIDDADVARIEATPERDYDSDVVMTTWHSKHTLHQALWYFINCANPTDRYSQGCDDYIIASSETYLPKIRPFISKLLIS